jgi:5-formyltetrahydrofolate cyclo-ligase
MSPEELAAYREAAKEALRQRVAALRRALPAQGRAERAQVACERVLELDAFLGARVVLVYAALRFELDPALAVARAQQLGKLIALPRVVPDSAELSLHRYQPGDVLIESGYGVREPEPGTQEVAPEDVDLVLVPGLAFDDRGYRLGYGKGFYDRLLPRLPRAARVGLAFDLSLLPEVPHAQHDVPVHAVITEKRVLWARSFAG